MTPLMTESSGKTFHNIKPLVADLERGPSMHRKLVASLIISQIGLGKGIGSWRGDGSASGTPKNPKESLQIPKNPKEPEESPES